MVSCLRRSGRSLALCLIFACVGWISKAAAETRGYVVSWFTTATYSQDGDCAEGPNPSADAMYRRILAELGKSSAEVDELMRTFPVIKGGLIANRGRIDGKPVNVYVNPTSVSDPKIHTVSGHYAYGFNLDGKGAVSPNSFEDPETHQRGVNNQLFRVLGCFVTERGTPPARPTYPAIQWDMSRDQMPAWIVEISGEGGAGRDGDVTVTFARATEPVMRMASGEPQADVTFRLDPNARTRNVVRGTVRNGVLLTDKFDFDMLQDPFGVAEYRFMDARLRLTFAADGSIKGILGGYTPWRAIYVSLALGGSTNEGNLGIDAPGVFYALRRFADAYPDPATGQNTAISAAYAIEAIPAFVVHPGNTRTAER
ncbi:MAG TPA: hypothetical protein VKZ79_06780 [Alphaproteobacteria bacterium]|nr:hypothetical protein [Alphaproteobacteria bacterium]